jgi:DNA-binding response OmpR family regulator
MTNYKSTPLKVLAVLPRPADRAALERIFDHSNWKLEFLTDLADVRDRVMHESPAIVICDSELPEGNWKELLQTLRPAAVPPRLIVALPELDCQLWAEVLNVGGYDALVKPFLRDEVVRLMSLAWLSWIDATRAGAPEPIPPRLHPQEYVTAAAS